MATFLVNRLPTPVLNWSTPYEVLLGKRPNYSSLRTFGCLSYVTNIKPHKGKFEPRAYKCVLLGFSPCQKAYKLYELDSKQIIVSRDVKHIFPYSKGSSCNYFSDPSPPLPVTDDVFFKDTFDNKDTEVPQEPTTDILNNPDQGGGLVQMHSTR